MQSWYNYIDNLVNDSNIINEKMPEIIEAFVDYYGEEMREKITDKFNNVTILQQITPKQIQKNCENISSEFEKQTLEQIKNILNLNSVLELPDYISNGITDEEKEQIRPLYKNLVFFQGHINKYIQALTLPIEKINEINLEGPLNDIKGLLNIEKDVYQVYFNDLIRREKEMFPPHLQEHINKIEYLNHQLDEKKINIDEFYNKLNELEQTDNLKEIKQMIGDFDGNEGLIDSFSTEANEKLQDKNASKWQKKQILQNRKKYLELFEKDMGNLDLDDMKKVLPEPLEADKFLLYKQEYEFSAKTNIYSQIPIHQKNLEIIKNNFPDFAEEDYIEMVSNENNLGSCMAELTNKNNQYFKHGLIVISKGENLENLDDTLIHELNHWLEINIDIPLDENAKFYSGTSGWVTIGGQIIDEDFEENLENQETEEDPYVLLDENINDQIARAITKKMHDKGTYIFSHKDHVNLSKNSYYQNYDFLTKDFFDEFKEEIIKSRQVGSFKYLDYRFDGYVTTLNDLVNKCQETLGHDIGQIIIDMEKGKITDEVKSALEFKRAAEILLDQMKQCQTIDNKQAVKHR